MKFYNIDVRGKFLAQRLSSDPVVSVENEGRVYYNSTSGTIRFQDSTANISIFTENNVAELAAAVNTFGGVEASSFGGQLPSYYTNAGNMNAGTLPSGRLSGSYSIDISGNAATATNSTCLGGQVAGYYNCMNNATGILAIANGGTGSSTAANARTALSVGGLTTTNTWSGVNNYSNIVCLNAGAIACRNNPASYSVNIINFCAQAGSKSLMVQGGGACGIYACANIAVFAEVYNSGGSGVYATTSHAVGNAVYGYASSNANAISGYSGGSGYAVIGNEAYFNSSSKFLKLTQDICITNCLKEKPLNIYKYMWEDSNKSTFNEFIGPVAEEFNETFKLKHHKDTDEYEGLYTVDGVALGLAIENMKEIEYLKNIIVKLYECIQKIN